MSVSLIPTILCGGAGSRLWPVSRELHPKPFIRLNDGQSLLQKAFLRGARIPGVQEILTVTNRELFFKTDDEFREVNIGKLATSFILEPFGRNTAAAVAAATLLIASRDPDTLLLILTADQLITDQAAFLDAVAKACIHAHEGKLVTFGIRPVAPETGYGYIEIEGNVVHRFVEKPDEKAARHYLESGRFLWNSGMFCFRAGSMLDEMQKYCPDILDAVRLSLAKARQSGGRGGSQYELDAECFVEVPDISIDYAIMEKSGQVAVVPCDMGWIDVGCWNAIGDLFEADAAGNRVQGDALLHDVGNCYIQSNERIIGAIGVNDLVIIDTPDALLVADRHRTQDVKHLYAELKSRGHLACKVHRTVHRPWGTYTVLEEGPHFKIKRIVVKPGASLSMQMHHHRSEHWVVVSGMAQVTNGENVRMISADQSTYIPAGHRHRLTNPGQLDLVMIEVQSGEYLGEDDIVRFEDHDSRF
ncbi:MAG TPA: mannose-1-phosphate guanylyltransferase/mannose-6-phosphate isomerase [Rhodocyclaceae bacterium]|nr:mannose-1-phosphate guanylyltransferase/mannose-6-phosphate isomerase [Rhodocyclaceae bacterium]